VLEEELEKQGAMIQLSMPISSFTLNPGKEKQISIKIDHDHTSDKCCWACHAFQAMGFQPKFPHSAGNGKAHQKKEPTLGYTTPHIAGQMRD